MPGQSGDQDLRLLQVYTPAPAGRKSRRHPEDILMKSSVGLRPSQSIGMPLLLTNEISNTGQKGSIQLLQAANMGKKSQVEKQTKKHRETEYLSGFVCSLY